MSFRDVRRRMEISRLTAHSGGGFVTYAGAFKTQAACRRSIYGRATCCYMPAALRLSVGSSAAEADRQPNPPSPYR